jgi:uncharacterized protein YkwD
MSTLLKLTNTAWLSAAAVIAVLALPGVSEASWQPARSLAVQSAQGACDAASSRIGEASDTQLARATLCLLNEERGRRGLPRLRLNNRLSDAAERHSRDMVRRNYFSHDSLSGHSFVDRIRRTGYLRSARSWSVGENLAWGSGSRGTPRSILSAWMASPGHRANILTRRFREIGIGVAEGAPVRTGVPDVIEHVPLPGGLPDVTKDAPRVASPTATYTTDFGSRG